MKSFYKNSSLLLLMFLVMVISSCFNRDPKRGEDLKGNEALELLAGKSEKCWKLTAGEDFLKMMCFSSDGSFRDQSDFKMKFSVDGDVITIKDYKDRFFTIKHIGKNNLTLISENNIVLIYETTTERPKANDTKLGERADKKWIAGSSYGSVWKGESGNYTYTFMNDGRFFDSNTGFKEEEWRWVSDKTINIGSIDCDVIQLTSMFFDIKMGGTTLKLKYLGEAGADGKPTGVVEDSLAVK